jgi:hypothetical protein
LSEVGGRDRRRNRAAASLGKYYSSTTNPNAIAICHIDIVTCAGRFRSIGVTSSNICLSSVEPKPE